MLKAINITKKFGALAAVDTLGKKADGVLGDMPAGVPVPQAPNAEAQAWLDKYKKRY
jgi:hypothetical protein